MKKEIKDKLDSWGEGDFDHTPEQFIEQLSGLSGEYKGKYLRLNLSFDRVYGEYGDPDRDYLFLYGVRLETDAEETKREAKELSDQQRRSDYERQQYESLKKKFEK